MARGFLYLVAIYLAAIMDWHSRYVVAWRLSNTPPIGVEGRLWRRISVSRRCRRRWAGAGQRYSTPAKAASSTSRGVHPGAEGTTG